jgi:hypothetical protein
MPVLMGEREHLSLKRLLNGTITPLTIRDGHTLHPIPVRVTFAESGWRLADSGRGLVHFICSNLCSEHRLLNLRVSVKAVASFSLRVNFGASDTVHESPKALNYLLRAFIFRIQPLGMHHNHAHDCSLASFIGRCFLGASLATGRVSPFL